MSSSKDKFNEAIQNVNVPILILDNKWHRIFGKMNPTQEIVALQEELAALLRTQGKLVNENKSLKKIKNDLMGEIVANMEGNNEATNKMNSDNKRLINEANEKLAANEDKLIELPREIDRVNKLLMIETMDVCYDRLAENTKEIEAIGEWIRNIRIELKKNIVKKQDKEIYNSELYSYMHDIFGPIVMELFDMKYVPSIHRKENTSEEVKKED